MAEEHQPNIMQDALSIGKVLLIDLENCPDQIHHLQKNLEEFSQVVICYAQTGAKIPLDWLIPLSATVTSQRLKIFKMTSGGKNAADFGICFFAGSLMQELHKDTHFVIISNDSDLDHVVNLLKSQGRSAERIGTQKATNKTPDPAIDSAPQPSMETVDTSGLDSALKLYCAHLMTYQKNRPAKQDTLLNTINCFINNLKNKVDVSSVSAVNILAQLVEKGAVQIQDNKVVYDDKIIQKLANS